MSDDWPARSWQVVLERDPQKVMRRIDADLRQRILVRLHELETTPRPPGVKKLKGFENLYRLRVGGWRITYAIRDDQLVVLVVEIAPRGGAYRDLS